MRYVIDFSSVNVLGLFGIEDLGSEDEVYVYVSSDTQMDIVDMFLEYMGVKAKVCIISMNLDKELCNVGIMHDIKYGLELNSRVVLVSSDDDFDYYVPEFCRNGWDISRVCSLV